VRNILGFFILSCQCLFALEAGRRYDFICSDGQDIFNAELIGEDSEKYYLKLSASIAKVPLEKKYVTRTIDKTAAPEIQREKIAVNVNALAGLAIATGRLAGFSGVAPAASLSGDIRITPRWQFVLRGDFQQFTKDTAYLRMILFSAGIETLLPLEYKAFRFRAGVSGGGAYLSAVTDEARQTTVVPAAVFWTGTNLPVSATWQVLLRIQAAYVYDAHTFVITPGFFLGAAYGF
jgi:hypothetical protein